MEFLRNKRLMIVVAHPDDEVLGIGATMNKLITDYGVLTRVIILGEGITSRSTNRDVKKWEQQLQVHRDNICQAQNSIGYQSVHTHNFPDNRFDSVPLLDIIKVIEKEKLQFKPEIIFTHHGGDVNIDHQRTFDSVVTACRPMKEEVTKTIITFETLSGTEWRASTDPKHFLPNFFVTINDTNLDAKIKAMDCYEFERRFYPHPRSPEAIKIVAQRWGVAIGSELAEAFCIIRSIQ